MSVGLEALLANEAMNPQRLLDEPLEFAISSHTPKARACVTCGGPVKQGSTFVECWRCYVQRMVDEARKAGFAAGHAAARREPAGPSLDRTMLRRLLQLCHPDRHDNSAASQEATRYLLGELNKHK